MNSTPAADLGAEILARTIKPQEGNLPVDAARAILEFRLAQTDTDRVNELAAKARAGNLTEDERSELTEYERISCLLELMQSKARLSLRSADVTSHRSG